MLHVLKLDMIALVLVLVPTIQWIRSIGDFMLFYSQVEILNPSNLGCSSTAHATRRARNFHYYCGPTFAAA